MLYKCMAIEGQRKRHKIATMLLHPGTVDTNLSQPFQRVGSVCAGVGICGVNISTYIMWNNASECGS